MNEVIIENHRLVKQDEKITADEYNTELINLKDKLKYIVNNMNIIRDNIKAQDKKIDNESI